MSGSITFSSHDTPSELAAKHEQLLASIRTGNFDEQLQRLQARILMFEGRYEMSSETMIRKFNAGELRETNEICQWLMLVKLRERVTRKDTP